MRVQDISRWEIIEIGMLQMIPGKILKDEIRNECIREIIEIESIYGSYEKPAPKMVLACRKND